MEEASRNENQKEFYKAVNETIGVKKWHKNITGTQIDKPNRRFKWHNGS